jgi:hypothetical protein
MQANSDGGECGRGFGEALESYQVQVAAEELNRTNLDIDETNNNRLCRPVTIALLADGDYNDSSLPHREALQPPTPPAK